MSRPARSKVFIIHRQDSGPVPYNGEAWDRCGLRKGYAPFFGVKQKADNLCFTLNATNQARLVVSEVPRSYVNRYERD